MVYSVLYFVGALIFYAILFYIDPSEDRESRIFLDLIWPITMPALFLIVAFAALTFLFQKFDNILLKLVQKQKNAKWRKENEKVLQKNKPFKTNLTKC